jgi:hypothetical protein
VSWKRNARYVKNNNLSPGLLLLYNFKESTGHLLKNGVWGKDGEYHAGEGTSNNNHAIV